MAYRKKRLLLKDLATEEYELTILLEIALMMMSSSELSTRLKVYPSTVSRWRSGIQQLSTAKTVDKKRFLLIIEERYNFHKDHNYPAFQAIAKNVRQLLSYHFGSNPFGEHQNYSWIRKFTWDWIEKNGEDRDEFMSIIEEEVSDDFKIRQHKRAWRECIRLRSNGEDLPDDRPLNSTTRRKREKINYKTRKAKKSG